MFKNAPYFGNTSYNNFVATDLHYFRGVPLTLRETDNNVFQTWGMNGPPTVPPAFADLSFQGATCNALEIEGSSDPTTPFPAINNVFVHGGCAGPIMCRGTASFTHPSGSSAGAVQANIFLLLDKGNGVPDPTVEAGAFAFWGDTDFIDNGRAITQGVVSDTRAGVEAIRNASIAPGGLIAHATSGPALRLRSASVDQEWGLTTNEDGSLTLAPLAASYFPLNVGQAGQPQIRLGGATPGNPVGISAYSSALANVALALAAQGIATTYIANGNGIQFQITDSGGPAANLISVRGGKSGVGAAIQVYGTDPNSDLSLAGQGLGLVRVTNPLSVDNSTAAATTSWVRALLISLGLNASAAPTMTQSGVTSSPKILLTRAGTPVLTRAGQNILTR
jgi:hypothetical protein